MALEVMMVDGQRLTLNGMRHSLDGCDDLRVSEALTCGKDLLVALKHSTPDVVLVDADLADMSSMKLLDLLRQNYPTVKVGVLFSDRDYERIHEALAAGAAACVMKDVDPADLPAAVRQVVEATVFTAGSALASVQPEPAPAHDLTQRELTMLRAIAQGASNKAISKEHWVTEQTVKFHLNNVYRKLGVPNRTAAARYAYQHGLLDQPQQATAI